MDCTCYLPRVATAEKIPMDDHSCQLITICTAAHWLDLPKVYAEGRRVLCTGGVMAIFCSDIPEFVVENSENNLAMKEVTDWVIHIVVPSGCICIH